MWVLLLFETLIKCRMVINVRTSTNQSDNLSKNYFHQFLPELWPKITFIFKFFYLSWLFRLCISSLLYKVRNEPAISCCCFYFFFLPQPDRRSIFMLLSGNFCVEKRQSWVEGLYVCIDFLKERVREIGAARTTGPGK